MDEVDVEISAEHADPVSPDAEVMADAIAAGVWFHAPPGWVIEHLGNQFGRNHTSAASVRHIQAIGPFDRPAGDVTLG